MSRTILDFNDGFLFASGEQGGADTVNSFDADWQPVTLPHDWSIFGKFNQYHPTGAVGGYRPAGLGWYRKHFTVPYSFQRKIVELEFGGIHRRPTVYLNGKLIADWVNGYVTKRLDISGYLEYGVENILSIRVDNELQPASRYYTGCGIYRDVKMIVRDAVCIKELHPFITTPFVSKESATVRLETEVENKSKEPKEIHLQYYIKDQAGLAVVKPVATKLKIGAGEVASAVTLIELNQPHLWDTDSPYRYTLETEVILNGTVTDRDTTKFGIRSIRFDTEKGLYLNEKRTYLKGVCLHHDNGALGAAENAYADRRRLQLMKEMGANAIRLSHNPFAESFLDLCDELGFLVMDEFFDEWKTPKNIVTEITGVSEYRRTPSQNYHLFFDDCWEEDMVSTIIRDRNHPSVILYSIGNEIFEQRQGLPGVEDTSAMLAKKVKEYDTTRPVTCACCFDQEAKTPAICETLDIVGYNYADVLFPSHHETFPDRLMLGSETVSISPFWKRGTYDLEVLGEMNRYVERQVGECFDQRAVRICSAETSMRNHMNPEYVSGVFIWTGIDYLGEPTPHPWPSRSAYFGAADTCCFPKDSFYYYQSLWSEKPVLHIFPHWNLKVPVGTPVDVIAFSNCARVELFLNGESQGFAADRLDRYEHFHWKVPYQTGELKAVGYDESGREIVTDTVVTAGPPKKLLLSIDHSTLKNDGRDTAFVTAALVDAKGNIVPTDPKEIEFSVEDGLSLLGVDNGDPEYTGDLKSDRIPTLGGLALAIVSSKHKTGNFQIVARIPGLSTASLFVKILPEGLC